MTDTCRSCHAEVVFVPSAKSGKPMVLDAKPAKGVVLGAVGSIRERPTWATSLDQAVASVVDVFTDHHATCPNADEWKGRHR